MAVYSVKVVRPSGVAHVAGARARLSIRLASEARHAGMLVNTDPVVVDLPASGQASVSLIPSDQLVSDSGRAALYHVEETWLDPDGVAVPGGYSSWGERFYLRSGGGALSDQLIVPPGIPGVYVRSTDPQVDGPVLAGELWIDLSTGEIKEWDMQTQDGWVPRGHLGTLTDQQIAAVISNGNSATAAAVRAASAAGARYRVGSWQQRWDAAYTSSEGDAWYQTDELHQGLFVHRGGAWRGDLSCAILTGTGDALSVSGWHSVASLARWSTERDNGPGLVTLEDGALRINRSGLYWVQVELSFSTTSSSMVALGWDGGPLGVASNVGMLRGAAHGSTIAANMLPLTSGTFVALDAGAQIRPRVWSDGSVGVNDRPGSNRIGIVRLGSWV